MIRVPTPCSALCLPPSYHALLEQHMEAVNGWGWSFTQDLSVLSTTPVIQGVPLVSIRA